MPAMSRRVTSCTPSAARVYAVAFDVQRLEVTGESRADGRRRQASCRRTSGAANFSVSGTGSLIYIPGPVSTSPGQLEIALMDRKGRIEPLKLPPGPYCCPACLRTARASPSGPMTAKRRSSISTTCPARARCSDSRSEGTTAFRSGSDSKRIAFQSDRDGDLAIFWQSADGGTAERLTKPEQGESHAPESWSPKGDSFLFSVTKGSDVSLWTFSLQDRKATPFGDVHSSNPTGAVFSPDGRWVAYTSTERNRPTIYVQPFPATGAQYQLPSDLRGRLTVALVTRREGTVLQPGARPIRGGQRHDATDVYVRESRGGAETVPNRSSLVAKGLRHHTRRQVRWFDPSGTKRSPERPWLRRSRWSSTGTKSCKRRVPPRK